MARLEIHPHHTVGYDEFSADPGPAVALDGYVEGPTKVSGDHANFNHHEGTDRFTTRATCEQVALALRMHMPLLAEPNLRIDVNDADPDICFAVWLLHHPDLVDHPVIERLCSLEGALDSSGGTCAPGTVAELETLAWIVDPWASQRERLAGCDAEILGDIIREVGFRIDETLAGRGGKVDLSATTGYDLEAVAGDVWVVREHHPMARARVCLDGATVFISVRPGPDERTLSMTVGKASPFVHLDLDAVYADLNAAELDAGGDVGSCDRWGGSDAIGGSPRLAGTRLDHSDVMAVVARHMGPADDTE